MKRCGNCFYFTKFKNRMIPGLCEKHDWALNENYGRKCQDHKPLKYDRIKSKALD